MAIVIQAASFFPTSIRDFAVTDAEVYYPGPLLMVSFGHAQVYVNGEAIIKPTFTSVYDTADLVWISVSWQAADGNGSSAALEFYFMEGLSVVGGKYAIGAASLPEKDNISGVIANPETPSGLWDGTYNTFIGADYKADDVLVIEGQGLGYKSKTIHNHVYLVQVITDEVGVTTTTYHTWWFQSGDNKQNAYLYYVSSEYGNSFVGQTWTGQVQPLEYNFSGSIALELPSNWMSDLILEAENAAKEVTDTAVDAYKDARNAAKVATDTAKNAADEAAKATTDSAKDATDAAKDATDAAIKATTDAAKDSVDAAEKAAKDAADAAKNATDDAKNASDNAKNAADSAAKNSIDSIPPPPPMPKVPKIPKI
ncbi:hypothetical protein [Emticicia sp. TH156]|uniref:hypothetical protein n=1 Tax=Emticicia sp. TH156 TaxID=2067454 RepID=UPI000C7610AB|nr:hypothetical protein [Emticicia sp. TH156]PLK44474.1 hypothetical protein C0V77_11865 [Emticicia sp. TH156]